MTFQLGHGKWSLPRRVLGRGLEDLLVAGLGLLQVLFEVERLEEHSRALVELGLELDPVQPVEGSLVRLDRSQFGIE